MVNILFANCAQFEGEFTNLGDWAIFEAMLQSLKREIGEKEIQIMVPSANPDFTMQNYPVKAFQRGGIKGCINTLKAIIWADVVLIGGGEIVQDLSSVVYLPYQFIRPMIAKLFRKKIYAYAIGIGEPWEISPLGRLQARFALNRFDAITVRDSKSKYVAENYLKVKNKNIYMAADPAIILEPMDIKENEAKDYFVFSIRSVYHRERKLLPFAIRKKFGLVSTRYYKAVTEFKEQIACVVRQVLDKYPYDIKFLTTYNGQEMSAGDYLFTKDIINGLSDNERLRIEFIEETRPCKIKTILGGARLVLSVPLHPIILAASEGVPVISLAYASKNVAFMKEIGMQKYIFPVRNVREKIDSIMIVGAIDEIERGRNILIKKMVGKLSYLKNNEKKNRDYLMKIINDDIK